MARGGGAVPLHRAGLSRDRRGPGGAVLGWGVSLQGGRPRGPGRHGEAVPNLLRRDVVGEEGVGVGQPLSMGAAGEPSCQICIAGAGPAGMMLGLLLARSGIRVKVLEKHSDFFRDFRGDTIHPSTLEILDELGLLDEFLKLPHQEVRQLRGQIGDTTLTLADFTHLPIRCKFLAFMPQWDFLNFLAARARVYPGFRLEMESEVSGLTFDGERVTGVRVRTPAGVREVLADLVVGTDGRDSTVREAAGLPSIEFGAPMDVLWMRVSRRPGDPRQLLGRVDYGQIFVMIDRGDYWQCGLVVRKGALAEIQRRGLEALRADIRRVLGRGREGRMAPPLILKILGGVPLLRRIPARLVGLGFRREHVMTQPAV